MTPGFLPALLGSWLLAALVMLGLWLVQRRTGDAGIVDVGWAATIAALAALHTLLGDADPARRLLAGAMGLLWGLRLAVHLLVRNHGRPEDGRYRELRRAWAPREQWGLFKFFQLQAIVAAFFSIPFLVAASGRTGALTPIEWCAAGLWAIAFVGETAADLQLERFKRRPGRVSHVCRDGLWNYSRHPNYFFESLVWIALALFASASPGGLVAWLCPAAILFFLFKVTGIPATEAQALRSKGQAYRDYQEATSAFIPWFPRRPMRCGTTL